MTTETTPAPAAPDAKVAPAPVASNETAPLPAEGQQPPGAVEAETPPEEPKKPKANFSERISQIHAAKKQAETERDSARREVSRLQQELQQIRGVDRSQLDPADVNRLDIHEALQTQRLRDEQRRAESASERDIQALRESFFEKIEAARETIPDLDAALGEFDRLPVGRELGEVIAESDLAAQIAHHLGRNPAEAARILRMPAHKQTAEIGKLEARLKAMSSARKTSTAPPPPTTLNGTQIARPQAAENLRAGDMQALFRKSGVLR